MMALAAVFGGMNGTIAFLVMLLVFGTTWPVAVGGYFLTALATVVFAATASFCRSDSAQVAQVQAH